MAGRVALHFAGHRSPGSRSPTADARLCWRSSLRRGRRATRRASSSSRAASRRADQIDAELPHFVDQLAIAIEAGMSFDAAVSYLAGRERRTTRGPRLHRILTGLRIGQSRRAAHARLRRARRHRKRDPRSPTRCSRRTSSVRRSPGILRAQAADFRHRRQMSAEERAQKAPVKMLFPIAIFVLPVMFVVILAPAFLGEGITLMCGLALRDSAQYEFQIAADAGMNSSFSALTKISSSRRTHERRSRSRCRTDLLVAVRRRRRRAQSPTGPRREPSRRLCPRRAAVARRAHSVSLGSAEARWSPVACREVLRHACHRPALVSRRWGGRSRRSRLLYTIRRARAWNVLLGRYAGRRAGQSRNPFACHRSSGSGRRRPRCESTTSSRRRRSSIRSSRGSDPRRGTIRVRSEHLTRLRARLEGVLYGNDDRGHFLADERLEGQSVLLACPRLRRGRQSRRLERGAGLRQALRQGAAGGGREHQEPPNARQRGRSRQRHSTGTPATRPKFR